MEFDHKRRYSNLTPTEKVPRNKTYILIFITAVILSGCVVNNGTDQDPIYVRCRAVMSKNTRAYDAYEVFPIATQFTLWSYTLPRGKAWSEHSAEALPLTEAKQFTGNRADTIWYCDTQIEWPLTKTLSLFACAPLVAGGTYAPERGICFDNYNAKALNYDLMYTDVLNDQLRENNVRYISVPFSHALCKVDVRAKAVTNTLVFNIKKITIKNLRYKGSFSSLATPQWSATDELTDYVVYHSDDGTVLKQLTGSTLKGTATLLMPQKCNATIEVAYTETNPTTGITLSKTAGTTAITDLWVAGKYYTYTLTFSDEGISFEQIIIE